MTLAVTPSFATSVTYRYSDKRKERVLDLRPIQYSDDVVAFLYGDLSSINYHVVQPLSINIEQEDDGTYVVSDDVFMVYGSGDDRVQAINDYAVSLSELYEILEREAASNDLVKRQFAHLQTYIQPKQKRGHDAVQAERN